MGIKLEEKYIKNKINAKFGSIEIYNPQYDTKILAELTKLIANNSKEIKLENEKSDIEVTNIIQIMRFMLSNLSNIENSEYWNSIDDLKLEEMLNFADGDFKKSVNSLIDIMLEIGNDIRIQSIRRLDILQNKLNELVESVKADNNINYTLAKFGLDREKLILLQNGNEEVVKEFQQNIIKNIEKENKPKRQYNKKGK